MAFVKDVHICDGKLSYFKDYIKTSNENRDMLFSRLEKDIPNANQGLKLIFSNNNGNIDNSNKLNAQDILYTLCCKVYLDNKLTEDKKRDFFNNLTEQLNDMVSLGQCPQGRTTRLLQILDYLKDL